MRENDDGRSEQTHSLLQRRRWRQAACCAAPQIRAQSKPEKLVYIGENRAAGSDVMVEEVAPAFEKATGIKVEFTLLPVDAWRARLKAELGAGTSGIDIAQWSVSMAGWMAPHLEDHEAAAGEDQAERDPGVRLGRLPRRHASGGQLRRQAVGIPYRITTGILHYQKALLEQAGFSQAPETFAEFRRLRMAVNTPPDRYALWPHGHAGAGHLLQPRVLAVLIGRAAGGLQDRRDVHQRAEGGGGAAILWRSRDEVQGRCRRRRRPGSSRKSSPAASATAMPWRRPSRPTAR